MKIFASERFIKAYYKGSLVIQRSCEHAVHDFVRSYRADPRNTINRHARVAGIRRRVLEIDVSRSGRLLAYFANKQLTLLDVGEKRIVPSYNDQKLDHDLFNCTDAPDQFWPEKPSGFFFSYPDTAIQAYGMENNFEWVYWLDEEQDRVFTSIRDDSLALEALLLGQGNMVFFIIGGPGTGKSCILLNLLKCYIEDFSVGLIMTSELVDYVEQSTEANVHQYLVDSTEVYSKDIVLVDDPANVFEIRSYAQLARNGLVPVVILAFDPLQLDDSPTDHEYQSLLEQFKVKEHALTASYRQKENVGKVTKQAADVIAASTPFLDSGKIKTFRQERSHLIHLANELHFRNPRGYTQVYQRASIRNILDEVNRINRPSLLWQHWYSLLIVEPQPESLREECYKILNRVNAKFITEDEIRSIRGLEFRHVFLFLEHKLYDEIENGFKGSGRPVYNERRLLRIPFSRAKDSLVIFVLDNE